MYVCMSIMAPIALLSIPVKRIPHSACLLKISSFFFFPCPLGG